MDSKLPFHLEAAEKGWIIKIFYALNQVHKEFETLNISFFANLERDLHVVDELFRVWMLRLNDKQLERVSDSYSSYSTHVDQKEKGLISISRI